MDSRILVIGHARHGKDTVAMFLEKYGGLTFEGSSQAAARIFLYDLLKKKYGYESPYECFEDRINRRAEWFQLIWEYNRVDRTRLAREILRDNDVYVGMRKNEELTACIGRRIFDWVIGVYDPRQPLESKDSFDIDIWKHSDFILTNSGTIQELGNKVKKIMPLIKTMENNEKSEGIFFGEESEKQ